MGRAAHSGGCRQDDPVEAELLASLRRDNAPRKVKQTPSKPNIASDKLDACRDFYAGLLGFQVAMDMGWILTFVSRATPTAQLSVVREDATAPVVAQVTVEVADVDTVHAEAVRRGLELVHPLTEEPWGVRRFFVKDPNGVVLNVASDGGDTPAAILETAVHLLADRPEASMAELAAAGVGRATLYHYFPTHEALLAALASEAHQELVARIIDASLDRAPVPEALQRLLRVFLTVGDRYVVLMRERVKPHGPTEREEFERLILAPIQTLFQRGVDDGTFRDDLSADALAHLFGGLVLAAKQTALPRTLGVEQTAASLASLFLDGARRHP